jgi:hypothetical protein
MKKLDWIPNVFLFTMMSINAMGQTAGSSLLPGCAGNWRLSWDDEFGYPDDQLKANWYFANGIQSWSRCREIELVSNGTLKLVDKQESRCGIRHPELSGLKSRFSMDTSNTGTNQLKLNFCRRKYTSE